MSKNLSQYGVAAVAVEHVAVAGHLSGLDRPLAVEHGPLGDVGRQHLAMVVGAEVVVEVEALDADELVELDPLAQVRCLVAVDHEDRQVGPAPFPVECHAISIAQVPTRSRAHHGRSSPPAVLEGRLDR